MNSSRSIAAAIALAVVLVGLTGRAARAEAGFRCGNGRVIRNGETESDVRAKCGAPDAVRSWTETRRETVRRDGQVEQRDVAIPYDEWTYDLGRDRLVRYLTFENGRLAGVRTGSYGKKPPG